MQPTRRKKIAEFIAIQRTRIGRGEGLISSFKEVVKGFIYLGAGQLLVKQWFGYDVPKEAIFLLGIAYPIVSYTLGFLDEKFGFWKFENVRNTKQLNPFFERMESQIDFIAERVGKIKS